jgi:long-chain acyl-CoA synthetase
MYLKDILLGKKNSQKVAIKWKNISIMYEQLFNIVNHNIKLIREIDEVVSDNIGIFLPNSIQYVIAFFTITLMDKVIVPISVQAKKAEIKSTIEYCELKIIITNTQYKDVLKSFLDDSDLMVIIFNLDDGSFIGFGSGLKDFSKKNKINDKISEAEVAILLHTSGTTSSPKRVMLTHKNLITNIRSNIESLKLTENDKTLIALPMLFSYCNTAQFLTHLYIGASIVIMEDLFMPNIFFKLVQDERVTNFTGVPPMMLMLLNYGNKHKYDISSLKYICVGGGKMPVEKLKELIRTFPTVGIVHTYGQTEASPRITALLPEDSLRKVGSVGKPIPNVKVKIVFDKERDEILGEFGEIIVQGDNVMKGYYKRPDETAKVIKDGWLLTGDLGRLDEEGFIYLIGRKKNMIVSGGINIYPEEIEELIMCHPAVNEVCVIREEHELLGEVPIAKIVLKEDAKISEGELKNYCMDNLANYKVPSKVEFVDELPKTATGKILKIERK